MRSKVSENYFVVAGDDDRSSRGCNHVLAAEVFARSGLVPHLTCGSAQLTTSNKSIWGFVLRERNIDVQMQTGMPCDDRHLAVH